MLAIAYQSDGRWFGAPSIQPRLLGYSRVLAGIFMH